MKPWDILGWAVIIVIVSYVGTALWTAVKNSVKHYWRYLRTRNTPLREGQEWMQDGTILTIGKKYPTHWSIGHIGWGCSSHWGETEDEWKQRVRNRKLYLVRDVPTEGDEG